ncbi:MAG TPA: bifunctional hydroxymethylpyrimidine kinase/phosphomethylpyrimidine kinase [Candidatus Omnitrophota bacterium]|nr:bifunctional hydroxymethylpyrimidine kinase/phosphomethylpyrimidine kinase [Candidatus Omnitrophota bacterium]
MKPVALTIAGSDPSGGAGIQADLKTFHQRKVYGMSVITLLTAQNTQSLARVEYFKPEWVLAQLDAVLADIKPRAAKTGALGTREIIEAVAAKAKEFSFPLVVDPVMISKHGGVLVEKRAVQALKEHLLPRADLVTPNIPEAGELSGIEITGDDSMKEAAKRIAQLGPKAVLIKGGHRKGKAEDLLYAQKKFFTFSSNRIDTVHTHGTGCTYSAAVTAELAKGIDLVKAVETAKKYVSKAIETAPGLGHGSGPVNHHAEI